MCGEHTEKSCVCNNKNKLSNAQDPDIFIQNAATTEEPESLVETNQLFGAFIKKKRHICISIYIYIFLYIYTYTHTYIYAPKLYFVFFLVLHKQYDSLNYST